MQKMELLLQKTPPEDVKSDVLPMVYRALETETASPQIQELCLVRVPDFASLVDYPAMKNALVILRPSLKNFFFVYFIPLSLPFGALLNSQGLPGKCQIPAVDSSFAYFTSLLLLLLPQVLVGRFYLHEIYLIDN